MFDTLILLAGIAATLVIGRRTVETHVENILVKLGFSSRTQVATWFAERSADSGRGLE